VSRFNLQTGKNSVSSGHRKSPRLHNRGQDCAQLCAFTHCFLYAFVRLCRSRAAEESK
jgi:hypothetical protein